MIYIIMGKSATGKDTIFARLIKDKELNLTRIIPYTTRPIRAGETNGEEYYFVDEEQLEKYISEGKVIERRQYNTVHGVWNYFTVDDNEYIKGGQDFAMITTLEAFNKLRDYYGAGLVTPIYIEVDDYERLRREMDRESRQELPSYEEVCRRYIADQHDFSEENLSHAGIEKRYNNADIEDCIKCIKSDILAGRN